MAKLESSIFFCQVAVASALISSAVTTFYWSRRRKKNENKKKEKEKVVTSCQDYENGSSNSNDDNNNKIHELLNFTTPIDRSGIYSVKHDLIMPPGSSSTNQATPIQMWVADMDLPLAPFIQQRLINRSKHSAGVGYTFQPLEGWTALAEWLHHHHQWTVHPDEMIFSASVVTSFANIVREFTSLGDAILVMTPLFCPLQNAITQCHRTLIRHSLTLKPSSSTINGNTNNVRHPQEQQQQYYIDFDLLQDQLDSKDIKIILLCNPHNPSGRVWTKSELQKLIQLCTERNILIVSDEIWCDWVLSWSPSQYTPLASLLPRVNGDSKQQKMEGKKKTPLTPRCITLLGPGKTWNLAGLHCSVVIIQHEETRQRYQNYAEPAFLHFGSAFATEALLSYKDDKDNKNITPSGKEYHHRGQAWLERTKHHVEENIQLLIKFCHNSSKKSTSLQPSKLQVIRPDATYLVWIDCSGMKYPSKTQALLAEKAGVILSNGNEFSPETEHFVRMNVACSKQKFVQALE
eukprot:CAMPEP_0195288572 /NCGR_PEP_ID=MMETSP0707-20130614/5189_1 /TAXON_ID=33640 /ORGANISM="Asterionellopsis glacialis, Strain CCMP134" /LENGTH=517 /DNA_ID=CAMNT_0040348461 /DNA_START=23 /DNA_END=1573 /DNA_ORIENTATION=-